MISKNQNTVRVALQALIALVILFSAVASASPAYAATPPANDDFATPTKMSSGFTGTILDMTGATSDAFDPPLTCDGGGTGEATVWYTFTASSSGEALISTSSSAYDTIITVWKSDTFGNLIEVGCNDDATAFTTTSLLSIPLRGGIKYYVEIARKSGTAVSAPDKLQLSFKFAGKVFAAPLTTAPFFYDGTAPVIYYTPTGWVTYNVPLPNIVYLNTVNVGNTTGSTAGIYFDGSYVQICYALGPEFGSMGVYIDGVYVATIAQGNAVYSYNCWDTPMPPIAGSDVLLDDNLHKLVLKNLGPTGKVNIDTIQVFPYPDAWPPDPITDLTATTGTSSGRVTLKWTATGDDGTFGRVTRNEVRYRLTSFYDSCPANWDSATRYTGTPTAPGIAGVQQTLTLSGLAPGVTYYFMVVGVDEAGNYGDPCSSSEDSAVANAPAPIGPGFYDDKHAGWTYSGVWSTLNDDDSMKDSLHQANKLDSVAGFYFTGSQFGLHYNADYNQGLLDVYVDGAYVTTIDQYAPSRRPRTFTSDVLTMGPHSVRFIQSSLPYVNIDAISIYAVVDGGPPDPILDLSATTGATFGTVDLTWTATGDDPAVPGPAGTATSYEVRYSTSGPIISQLDWENASTAATVIPAPQSFGSPEGLTVVGLLPNVDYWFAVRVTDDAHFSVISNTDDAIASDGGMPYLPAGYYEDSDLFSWVYNGVWAAKTNQTFASNLDQHQCSLAGSSAFFLFNGDTFRLIYQTGPNFVSIGVYVDGVKIGGINQKSLSDRWQKSTTFTLGAAGDHVIQLVCAGTATLDAIEIFP